MFCSVLRGRLRLCYASVVRVRNLPSPSIYQEERMMASFWRCVLSMFRFWMWYRYSTVDLLATCTAPRQNPHHSRTLFRCSLHCLVLQRSEHSRSNSEHKPIRRALSFHSSGQARRHAITDVQGMYYVTRQTGKNRVDVECQPRRRG